MDVPHVEWRTFVVALATALACVATFWLLIPPTYLTNDDVAIRRAIEGVTAPGEPPTGFVLWTHSLLAWALVVAQRVVPVHWWDFVLAGLLVCASATILALAWTFAGPSRISRVTGIGVVLVALVPLVGGLQFTISATLAAGAAVALAATELFGRRPRAWALSLSASMLLLGLLVRPMGATAGALLTGLLLTPAAFRDPVTRRSRLTRLGTLMAVSALTSVALVYLDDALYRLDGAWNDYHTINWMTARLFEWGGAVPATAIDEMRTDAGWSANDWNTLGSWWAVDSDVHSLPRITAAYTSWGELATLPVRLRWLLDRAVVSLSLATLVRLSTEAALPLAAAAVFVAAQLPSRRDVVTIGLLLFLSWASCVGVEIAGKELPFRLFAPLQACALMALVVTFGLTTRSVSKVLHVVASLLIVAFLWREGRDVIAEAAADVQQTSAIEQQVNDLLELRPTLVVLHADSFPSEHWWKPFRTPHVPLATIQLGMNNFNPYVQRFLTASNHQPLLQALCADPSILVVAEHDRLEPATTFLHEHFQLDVEWTEVYAGSFRAWRCTPKT